MTERALARAHAPLPLSDAVELRKALFRLGVERKEAHVVLEMHVKSRY